MGCCYEPGSQAALSARAALACLHLPGCLACPHLLGCTALAACHLARACGATPPPHPPLPPCPPPGRSKPVFLIGEEGLKKDYLAAQVHGASPLTQHLPMLRMDCHNVAAAEQAVFGGGPGDAPALLDALALTGGTLLLSNVHLVRGRRLQVMAALVAAAAAARCACKARRRSELAPFPPPRSPLPLQVRDGPFYRKLRALLHPGCAPAPGSPPLRVIMTAEHPVVHLQQGGITVIKVGGACRLHTLQGACPPVRGVESLSPALCMVPRQLTTRRPRPLRRCRRCGRAPPTSSPWPCTTCASTPRATAPSCSPWTPPRCGERRAAGDGAGAAGAHELAP